ncbi:MAG: CvpA family protein [Ignavibacteria bacterium]|nr:CvpA family protein [Ignavibacteria bacterium]MBT8381651.1 CvpA family protein [Ignavibacteria bacterium]MBT8391194.1 CvpA family protein [Ignavibacteria bacterium]NNJ53136.1 CvpA family protein [Ignavibacteriaceae bacterium]NNL19770.1 CvpA family protein [Ignavibacteriaceae bacterium]
MNLIDALILIGVLVGFILGFKDGFVRKLIGIIGFAIAIFCAVYLSGNLGLMIENALNIEFYLSEIIAGILIFFGIIIVFTIIKRVVHPFDKVNNLINQLVGGTVGVIQILFFISALFLIMNVFNFPNEGSKQTSIFYNNTSKILPLTINFLRTYTPEPKQIIKDYIERKDTLE